ncbi:MAG: MFS transporter [Gemmatimonadales bacterium]|nr:MFS transporter [Gemmatimonadales bacterium]
MSDRRPLPRQVKLFGAVSLLNDFASEMVYPLLPAFITGVLGGGAAAIGALDGAADAAAAAVKLGAGKLSDHPRRRGPLIVIGYLVAVVIRPVIAVTAAAWQVIGLRVVDRLGKGMRGPPRDAVIADVTPREQHGRAFGLQRGLDHVGAILGPLVAWGLLSAGAEVRAVILASIVPGILVLVLALLAVGRPDGRTVDKEATIAAEPRPSGRRSVSPSVLAISFFYLLRMPEALIILHAQRLGVAIALIPLLWAGVHVIKSGSSFVGGALSDRIGPSRTMWLGWASYVVLAAGMAVASGPLAAWVLFLAIGVVAGLTESPERSLVAALAGPKTGSGFGVYHAATGVAALIGGVGLGLLFQQTTAARAFVVSAALGLILVLLWPFVARGPKVPPR